jgi:hypothetical protein
MKSKLKYYTRYLLILSLLFSVACAENEPRAITGKWKATALEEEGEALEVQLDKIQFTFYPDAKYDYKSTLNYREAGNYQLKSKYLYTTDTLNMTSVEKVVEITRLLPDTMVIRMEQNGKERMLTLAREE